MTLLELTDVVVHYGPVAALKGVTLSVETGAIVTLIGGNGAGKTTTLKTISGLRRPSTGTITFEGEPIHGLAPHELVKRGIGQAPEGRGIFPGMTVMENLGMGAYLRKGSHTDELTASSISSRAWPSAARRAAARSRAASSRCSRSAERS